MRCPRCGSTESERFKSPVTKEDVILRRHRCTSCGLVYLSVQTVVTEDLLAELSKEFDA